MTYGQSYLNGSVNKTTIYTYTGTALLNSLTYKDTAEVTSGIAPSMTGKELVQKAFYTGAAGEELMRYSEEWGNNSATPVANVIKTTTIYTYGTGDISNTSSGTGTYAAPLVELGQSWKWAGILRQFLAP